MDKYRVKIIQQGKHQVLVEYLEKSLLKRVSVPVSALEIKKDGITIKKADIESGIEYGVNWSEIQLPAIDSTDLNTVLHRRGIWTADDARKNPELVRKAIDELYGRPLAMVLNFIKNK